MTQQEFDALLASGDQGARTALLGLAIVLGVGAMAADSRRWPLTPGQRLGVFVSVLGGGLAGAFLPALVAGGLVGERVASGRGVPMSILGGLAFSFLSVAAYKRSLRVDWDTSDAFARGTCLMMAVGRLGCHFSRCCPGVKMADGARVPIQLIEAGLMFGLYAVFHLLEARDRWPHRRLFLFFVAYGLLRFVLEFWREPMGAQVAGLGSYQWFALGLAGLGSYQVIKRTRRLVAA